MSAATPLDHRLSGDGPPVVLLNGGMMTHASWEPFAARLRPRHRLLTFDFRGQLLSPGVPPPDLAGHAADLVALLDALGWGSAHLVGTSFGALVAVQLAAASPDRVRSLTLITAMDRATPEWRRGSDEMRRLLAGIDRPGGRERFWDVLVDGVYSAAYRQREAATLAVRRAQLGLLPAAWFGGVADLLATLDDFDLTPRLAEVRSPALVVRAADDQVMSGERSHALAAALDAEEATHPASGHSLVVEDPDWLAGVCLDFLARQEAARS